MGQAMIEIREFIHPQTFFDPETIQVLASALDDAWDRIEKSGSRFARPAYARAMREVLAKRIIESAQRGEMDKLKLAADAVKFLAANYMDDNAGKAAAAKHGGSEADTPRCGHPVPLARAREAISPSLGGSSTRGRAPRPPATLTSAIALQRRWPARWRQSKRRLEQFVPEGVGAVPLAFEVRPLTSHYCLKLDDLHLQCLDLRLKNGGARRARGWGPH
jgi:hypothetical protein